MSNSVVTRNANAILLDHLSSPTMSKTAEAMLTDFTRYALREEGAWRRILPLEHLPDSELNVVLGTDLPVKILWKEPQSHGAMTIPFAGSPRTIVLRGSNYPLYFTSIVGTKYLKHLDELRVYPYDIRAVLTDHSTRDVMEEEDTRFFVDGMDAAMVGVNQTSPFTGTVQWRTLDGGWTRANVIEALKALPSGVTKAKADKAIVNHVTVYDFLKWGRDEAGGDPSADMLKSGMSDSGWLSGEMFNTTWLVTIKQNLVPNGTIYFLNKPEYVGHSLYLQDITLFTDRRGPWIEFYPWETVGGAIGNVGGIARRDIN